MQEFFHTNLTYTNILLADSVDRQTNVGFVFTRPVGRAPTTTPRARDPRRGAQPMPAVYRPSLPPALFISVVRARSLRVHVCVNRPRNVHCVLRTVLFYHFSKRTCSVLISDQQCC